MDLNETFLLNLGISVTEDCDQPGMFVWKHERDGCESSFEIRDKAVQDAIRWALKYEICVCDNCGKFHFSDEVPQAKDLSQRTEPGGVIPAGECTACGALCYPLANDPGTTQDDGAPVDELKARIEKDIATLRMITINPVSIRYAKHIDFEVRPESEDDRILVGREGWGTTVVNYTHEGLILDVLSEQELEPVHAAAINYSDLIDTFENGSSEPKEEK